MLFSKEFLSFFFISFEVGEENISHVHAMRSDYKSTYFSLLFLTIKAISGGGKNVQKIINFT